MIRATVTGRGGRKGIILGLEEGNIERLRQGKPIHIHADELGFAGDIMIVYGKTQEDIAAELAPHIGPETVMRDDRERKKQ